MPPMLRGAGPFNMSPTLATKKSQKESLRIMKRQPKITRVTCQVGNHTGVFPITRTRRGWACDEHLYAGRIKKMAKQRTLKESDKVEIMQAAQTIGDHLIALGRAYVKSVEAPNRNENQDQEHRFCHQLGKTVIAVVESGVTD